MELKTYFAQDASGNIMPGATVTVYEAGTATLATGLQDESGSPLANPFTADSSAKVAFYAPDGLYDITVVGNGRTVTIRAQFVSVDGAIVLRSDLAATGGSALVGFQQAGTGAVPRTLQDESRGWVTPEQFGAKGDNATDDTTAFSNAATYAAAKNMPIRLNGGQYLVTTLTLSVNATFVGSGTIRKQPGTTGHLIVSTANLQIESGVVLDQNAANCPNPSASYDTDCAITHSGDELILRGVKSLASVSANINTSAKKLLVMDDCDVTGGWLCLRGVVAAACRVRIRGGRYSGSTVYDNIQLLNTQDYVIDGVTSHDSKMSCIVLNESAANGSVTNNICYGAGISGAEGGWGIVMSVLTTNATISGNHCYNNARGGITLDTTPIDGSTNDARLVVSGNTLIGDYAGGYGTTGINVNKANQVVITSNTIRKFTQSILFNVANKFTVARNIIEDCGGGYFFQATSCTNFHVSNNVMHTCATSAAGAVSILSSSQFKISDNVLSDVNGAGRNAFKFTNLCSDFAISDNKIDKADAGTGHMLYVAGNLTNARFTGNKFRSPAAAWQYYIVATGVTLVDVVTEHNEIVVPSVQTNPNRYVLNGAAIVGDGDIINGIRDKFSAAPTAWTFRNGYMAINNNIPQFWNGTAWVNI